MNKINKKILHTTISPCENERRIFNQGLTASRNGYTVEVLAYGTNELPSTSLVENVVIQRIKISNHFSGLFKFLIFNGKLFWKLLHTKFDIIHDHDLWVLPASAMAAWLKRKPIIFDAHEFSTGLEVFKRKPTPQKVWCVIERFFIRKINVLITINTFHGDLFQHTYSGIPTPNILMNFPFLRDTEVVSHSHQFSERTNKVIFQGVLKHGRSLKTIIKCMSGVENGILEIIGFGDLENELKEMVQKLKINSKVIFRGKKKWNSLIAESAKVKAGLVLFEGNSLNYKYASPNKFFEYVNAGTPVIASDIPTFHQFISEFEVGILVKPDSMDEIAKAINLLLNDSRRWNHYHKNCLKARKTWCWENQEIKLLEIYKNMVKK